MPSQISLRTRDGAIQAVADKNPTECPICHVAVTPIDTNLGAKTRNIGGAVIAERVFLCPNETCEHLFIARYLFNGRTPPGQESFRLYSCLPLEIVSPKQSETISKVSPDFCSIYEQAYKAEQHELLLVAGPGYRKALEFLLKDYIISQLTGTDAEITTKRATVEKSLLGTCIANYIQSEQIKEISKRAAWLGNDETHYVRKWEDKDLNDLKKLISLTLYWIEMATLSADVIANMPDGKT